MKVCTKCGTAKEESEFWMHKAPSGNKVLNSWCKVCQNEYAKDRQRKRVIALREKEAAMNANPPRSL